MTPAGALLSGSQALYVFWSLHLLLLEVGAAPLVLPFGVSLWLFISYLVCRFGFLYLICVSLVTVTLFRDVLQIPFSIVSVVVFPPCEGNNFLAFYQVLSL